MHGSGTLRPLYRPITYDNRTEVSASLLPEAEIRNPFHRFSLSENSHTVVPLDELAAQSKFT
jgi:hypothetical protein